jgi:hypothetical protein
MSLFGSLFNRKRLYPEQEKDRTVKEILDEDEEQLEEEEELTEEASDEDEKQEEETALEEEEDPNQEYEVVEREILPAKIICPDCGGITLEGLDFCDKCGGELN